MRGLIPAHIMSYIEDRTGLRMAQMVDVFTGPSTGAILNGALNIPDPDSPTGKPRFRARHMVKFYEREGKNIFPHDSYRAFRAMVHDFNNRTMQITRLKSLFRHGHYDPGHLGRSLRILFGEMNLKDSLRSLIIPVFDLRGQEASPDTIGGGGGQAVWLKNMREEDGLVDVQGNADVSLFDAVMGSTAAPTYFPCHCFSANIDGDTATRHITAIDGSIFDNPCVNYYGALRRHIPHDHEVVMIALGTGFTLKSISQEEWNSYGNLGVVDPANDLPLINILFHAPESALLDGFHAELGAGYHSFNKSILAAEGNEHTPSVTIDDASAGNLRAMKHFAGRIIEEQADALDALCELLVTQYEAKDGLQKRGIFGWVGS